MSQDTEYEHELTASRNEIAAVLTGVADGIRTGAVRLGDTEDAVTVDIPDDLTLDIELEVEDGEIELELELEWSDSTKTATESTDEETVRDADDETGEEETAEVVSLAGTADNSHSLAQFEIYQGRDDEWRWRLRHRNGNIIATSGEGYTRKHNAVKGLRSVMTNAPDAPLTEEAAASWPVE